jgi:hypothetical protein
MSPAVFEAKSSLTYYIGIVFFKLIVLMEKNVIVVKKKILGAINFKAPELLALN